MRTATPSYYPQRIRWKAFPLLLIVLSSAGEVTQSSQTKQEKENKFSPTPRKDGESIIDYAERVAEEHQAQRTRKEEEAKDDTNPTEAQKPTEENAAPANTQTEETNNSRGDSQSKEQPTEVPTGVRSSNENGTLPQSTPTEVDEPQPIGNSVFGKVYNQFKGKVKEAVNFLMRHKSGKLLGVFHRNDIGEISLVWGDEKGGLAHIISKHIVEQNDFNNIDEVINTMLQVINNGTITRENKDKVVIDYNDYRVAIRKQTRDNNGNVVEQGNWGLMVKCTPEREQKCSLFHLMVKCTPIIVELPIVYRGCKPLICFQ